MSTIASSLGRRLAIAGAALLLAACGGSDKVAGPGGGGGDTPRSELPAALAGTWVYGNISPTNFWNEHTGQYAGNAYGFADYLSLDESGTYTTAPGCDSAITFAASLASRVFPTPPAPISVRIRCRPDWSASTTSPNKTSRPISSVSPSGAAAATTDRLAAWR